MEKEKPKDWKTKWVPMTYKDPETGEVLYGFTQVNQLRIYKMLWVLVVIFAIFLIMAGYILWKIEAYNIVGKYIARCIC